LTDAEEIEPRIPCFTKSTLAFDRMREVCTELLLLLTDNDVQTLLCIVVLFYYHIRYFK